MLFLGLFSLLFLFNILLSLRLPSRFVHFNLMLYVHLSFRVFHFSLLFLMFFFIFWCFFLFYRPIHPKALPYVFTYLLSILVLFFYNLSPPLTSVNVLLVMVIFFFYFILFFLPISLSLLSEVGLFFCVIFLSLLLSPEVCTVLLQLLVSHSPVLSLMIVCCLLIF